MRLIIESNKIDVSSSFQKFVEELWDGITLSSISKEDLIEYLSDNESDAFWDCLLELYPEGELVSKISCEVAEATFISKTQENIETNRNDYDIAICLIGESDEIVESYIISGADVLLEYLDNEITSTEFYAKVSGYVEESLELFVNRSSWHVGTMKKDGSIFELMSAKDYSGNFIDELPVLWFGPSGEIPEDIWVIKYGETLLEMWFEDDQWLLIEYLVDDCNDAFSTWYIGECGRWLPDMEEILNSCPVKFEVTDTIEKINIKFKQYFN